jgi:uncharacterized protein (UPF0212 family)
MGMAKKRRRNNSNLICLKCGGKMAAAIRVKKGDVLGVVFARLDYTDADGAVLAIRFAPHTVGCSKCDSPLAISDPRRSRK